MISYARCCSPIAGDPVLGIVTRGRGISVHRRDCSNIRNITEDRERILELDWESDQEEAFSVQIQVEDRFQVEVKNAEQLTRLFKKITGVPGVTSAYRLDNAPEEEG